MCDRFIAALQLLYRLISGCGHACIEAIKRLAVDAISNSSSLINDNTNISADDSMHILTALSYHTNDDANTASDREILPRLFASNTNTENTTNTTTTSSSSVLGMAVSKRLIDDVAFVKRIGRVPESQSLDIKALFKSGMNIYILVYLVSLFIVCYSYCHMHPFLYYIV